MPDPAPAAGASAALSAPPPGGTPPPALPPAGDNLPAWAQGLDLNESQLGTLKAKGLYGEEKLPFGKVVDMYGNLEKIARGDPAKLVSLDDPERFTKLGVPANAKDYDIPVPEGGDTKLADAVRPLLKAANVSKESAKTLIEGWNNLQTEQAKAAEAAKDAAIKEGATKLRSEWGNSFNKNLEAKSRAMSEHGITDDQFDSISDAIGVEAAAKLFAKIGTPLLEHDYKGTPGGSTGFGVNSPEQAKAILASKNMDKSWADKAVIKGTPEYKERGDLIADKEGMARAEYWNGIAEAAKRR